MNEGEVVKLSPGETITCIRSGQSGGAFVFDLELAPGAGHPPTHTHDEGDETIEVLEGEMAFRVNGAEKLLRKGDQLTLTPKDAHTFWNPSKTTALRARVIHGARFERLVAQPGFLALIMYLTYVDPGASRATHPVMKALMRVVAWIGKLRGAKPVIATV
jgi:mannose-6-phosphate isomerase-like protein (cupin superfamily)